MIDTFLLGNTYHAEIAEVENIIRYWTLLSHAGI